LKAGKTLRIEREFMGRKATKALVAKTVAKGQDPVPIREETSIKVHTL